MRQGLFPISIVCALIAAASQKDFDKSSIATEKSFCNSKSVHSRSKQCLRIYKDHFALQNACWEIPNPWTTSDGCRLRVFAKRSFSTPQECAAITERDVHRYWDCIPTSRTRTANFQCRAGFGLCAHKGTACGRKHPMKDKWKPYCLIWNCKVTKVTPRKTMSILTLLAM